MNVGRVGCVIVCFAVILFLANGTSKPDAKVSRSPDRYTALIRECVKKALTATEGYYIPIKYNNYDKAKVWARDYKVLTEQFGKIVEDCPKERYREKNMLKAAMNVVANRNSSLWAYTILFETRIRDESKVFDWQEKLSRYVEDAEKYRQVCYNTYGF